ncbi:MAG: PKD domain-containing protein, partial [Gemmatimonadales bacterium]
IDPDGETFWYLGEYSKNTGTSNGRWGTYISSFSFNCDATPLEDTDPPVRSDGQPSGTLPAGTTEAVLALSTDENATCRYGTVANKDFASMTPFGTTGEQAHQSTVNGLGDGQSYDFFVRCQDGEPVPNVNTDDYGISFSVAAAGTPPATLHIADLEGTAINLGKNWQASVAPMVHDNNDQPVDGAEVYVGWTGDASGSASCTTESGTCDITTSNIPKKHTNSVVFTVSGITHASLNYESTYNADLDGDSSGTAIQVNKDGTTQDPGNQSPSAGFSFTTNALMASFKDLSSDSDGTIVSRSWDFGDGDTSTAQSPSHPYGTAGTYSVSLTVTDNNGAEDTDMQMVPVGVAAPTVTGCSPASGNPNQRLTVTVTGTGFQDGATVDFGDRIAVQGVTVNGLTELAVRIKVHRQATSGGRNVTVTNPDGVSGNMATCFAVN